jgi:hypothetical protein
MDTMGMSPMVWKLMIEKYGVHSLLDVGCGRGIGTSWFLTHGVDILCAEDSHDVIQSIRLSNTISSEALGGRRRRMIRCGQ